MFKFFILFFLYTCVSPKNETMCDSTNPFNFIRAALIWRTLTNEQFFCNLPMRSKTDSANTAIPTFTISGNITGLNNSGLILRNNNGADLIVLKNSSTFSFPTPSSNYSVTINAHPFLLNCVITNPSGTATANVNNVNINCATRELNIAGNVSTIAGDGNTAYLDAVGTSAKLVAPSWVATDGSFVYFNERGPGHMIRRIDLSTLQVTTIAGQNNTAGSTDGIGTAARFDIPEGIYYEDRELFITTVNPGSCYIRKMNLGTNQVSTISGVGACGSFDSTIPLSSFNNPIGMLKVNNILYVADFSNNKIRALNFGTNLVTIFAGDTLGNPGQADAIGTAASFRSPAGLTHHNGIIYATDFTNHTIRKIQISTASVTTIAGLATTTGAADGIGTVARFWNPLGIVNDGKFLYIADRFNHCIRKLELSTNNVTTVAGFCGMLGYAEGTGNIAKFDQPYGLTTDGFKLYVADLINRRIRKIE
jgi:hypothetical protein